MRYNHREGCIEAKEITLSLRYALWISATHVGPYRNAGIIREIEAEFGLRIEGDRLNIRQHLNLENNAHVVKVYDDWVQPTRR